MDRAELLDDGALLGDALVEAFLELAQLPFFLVQILYQASAPFLHLVQAPLKTDPVWGLIPLSMLNLVNMDRILRMPHIVRDELLKLSLPGVFQLTLIHILYLLHQSVHVLNQDVISSD